MFDFNLWCSFKNTAKNYYFGTLGVTHDTYAIKNDKRILSEVSLQFLLKSSEQAPKFHLLILIDQPDGRLITKLIYESIVIRLSEHMQSAI